MKLGENQYRFITKLNQSEIKLKLEKHTLKSEKLIMVSTGLDFIGKIQDDSFNLIPSFSPIGVGCIINGKYTIEKSEVQVVTKTHPVFILLWKIWIGAMIALTLFLPPYEADYLYRLLVLPIIFLIGAPLFRVMIHGFYVFARNKGIARLKKLIELEEFRD